MRGRRKKKRKERSGAETRHQYPIDVGTHAADHHRKLKLNTTPEEQLLRQI